MKKNTALRALLLVLAAAPLFGQNADGAVTAGEYANSVSLADGGFVLHWTVKGRNLFMAVDSEAPGWVSVGFDPVSVMDQADMIFGLVGPDGSTKAVDAFSTGVFGPHPADTSLGGSDDILKFAGRRKDGRVVFEFVRRLDTGDNFDKPILRDGSLKLIWAWGEDLDFNSHHVRAGSEIIGVKSGAQEVLMASSPQFLFLHVIFMVLASVLMIFAFALARFYKKTNWWLKLHRPVGITGSIAALAGIGFIYLYIEGNGGSHFRVPHGLFGLAIAAGAAAVPILGILIFKVKTGKAVLRKVHRWLGRVTVVSMVLNLLSGLFLTGVLRF